MIADNSVGFPPPKGPKNGKPVKVSHGQIQPVPDGEKPSHTIHIYNYQVTKFQAGTAVVPLDDGRNWTITYYNNVIPLLSVEPVEPTGESIIVKRLGVRTKKTSNGYFELTNDFFTKVVVRQEDNDGQHTTENTFREVKDKPMPFVTCVHYVLKNSTSSDTCK